MLMKHQPLTFQNGSCQGKPSLPEAPGRGFVKMTGSVCLSPPAQPSPLLKTSGRSHDRFVAAVGPVSPCMKGSVRKHASSEAPGRGWGSAAGRTGVSRGNSLQGPPVTARAFLGTPHPGPALPSPGGLGCRMESRG